MYYNYRKQIYTVLIIAVLLADFMIGKSMGTSISKRMINKAVSNNHTENLNINYDKEVDVTGENYSASLILDKASIDDDGSLIINVNETKNNDVVDYKVLAFGANNQSLDVEETNVKDKNYEYSIQFDNTKDKNISIKIYPLSKEMKVDSSLSLDNAAYENVTLNIDSIKKEMINRLNGSTEGNDGK